MKKQFENLEISVGVEFGQKIITVQDINNRSIFSEHQYPELADNDEDAIDLIIDEIKSDKELSSEMHQYIDEEIVDFIIEKCSLSDVSTKDTYNIYGKKGHLKMTRGNHEFRDDSKHLITFSLYRESAPYDRNDIEEIVAINR